MNQILVSEKLYVTPELKRKKVFFKIQFILSVFLLCIISSCYIYAEYDRNKNEKVSQEILSDIEFSETQIVEEPIIVVLNRAFEIVEEQDIDEVDKQEVPVAKEQEEKTSKDGVKYTTIGVINIPKLNINYPILSATSVELLKISPCRFWGPDPNEVGNLCIVAHNYRNSKFFSKLSTLENGDIVEITDLLEKTLTYKVYDKFVVDPENLDCTSQRTNGHKEITLITCTQDSKHRTIVKARAEERAI